MQVALITPPALQGMVLDTHYNLILAQELHRYDYSMYWQNKTVGTTIMDNGAAEGEMLSDSDILKMAMKVEPNYIVCPDYLGDSDKTIEAIQRFRRTCRSFPDWKYLAVAQGSSTDEVVDCAKTLLYGEAYDWLAGICLPRLMLKFGHGGARTARIQAAERLVDAIGTKVLHCLGSGAWCEEVSVLSDIPWVTGIDTSAPVAMGLRGQNISTQKYEGRPNDYFGTSKERGRTHLDLIRHNVRTYLGWARA